MATKLDYVALSEEIHAQVDEFAGLKKRIVAHMIPFPGMKSMRSAVNEWLNDLQTDLAELAERIDESAAVFGDSKAAVEAAAAEEETVESAVDAAITGEEGDESTEPETESETEPETTTEQPKPTTAKRGGRKAAVPA